MIQWAAWNYDAENRKPPKAGLKFPHPMSIPLTTLPKTFCKWLPRYFDDHFGDLQPFPFAVTRTQALDALIALFRKVTLIWHLSRCHDRR